MFRFKINVLEALKEKGITTTTIRKENIMGQKTLLDIKSGIVPGIKTLDVLCERLDLQIGDIIEHVHSTEVSSEQGDISAKTDN